MTTNTVIQFISSVHCPCLQALTEYSALENFWRRYNTALLDRTALALQKADLRSENQQLQKMLRDYLENLRAGTVTKAEGILPQVRPGPLLPTGPWVAAGEHWISLL